MGSTVSLRKKIKTGHTTDNENAYAFIEENVEEMQDDENASIKKKSTNAYEIHNDSWSELERKPCRVMCS